MEKTTTAKLTKVEKFNMLLAIPGVAQNATLVEFINHEIELLSKKNQTKKPTKTQVENESIKDYIYEGMESGKQYTVTEIIKAIPECNELTCQKVSALLRQMEKSGMVNHVAEKRRTLYFKVEE